MSTPQTDAHNYNEQSILEDFCWWLDMDFHTADMLWQAYQCDNDISAGLYNKLEEVYNDHVADMSNLSNELLTTNNQKHV